MPVYIFRERPKRKWYLRQIARLRDQRRVYKDNWEFPGPQCKILQTKLDKSVHDYDVLKEKYLALMSKMVEAEAAKLPPLLTVVDPGPVQPHWKEPHNMHSVSLSESAKKLMFPKQLPPTHYSVNGIVPGDGDIENLIAQLTPKMSVPEALGVVFEFLERKGFGMTEINYEYDSCYQQYDFVLRFCCEKYGWSSPKKTYCFSIKKDFLEDSHVKGM